jgi:hypothetical protein
VAGSVIDVDEYTHFALARYNADGTLDPSCSGDGKQMIDFASGSGEGRAVVLQGDGSGSKSIRELHLRHLRPDERLSAADASGRRVEQGLLPQPGAFEGFLPGGVLTASRNLPVADAVDDRVGEMRLDPAQLRAARETQDPNDLARTGVDQLLRLDRELIERVEPVLDVGTAGLLAVQRTAIIECPLYRSPLHIVRPILGEHVQALLSHRVEGGLHDLHVLPRHRLLPQPGGFERFFAAAEGLESDHFSASDRPDVGHEGIDRHPAGLPGGGRAAHYDHAVLVLYELLGVAA